MIDTGRCKFAYQDYVKPNSLQKCRLNTFFSMLNAELSVSCKLKP